MTPKERALAAIEGRPADKVAVHHLQFSGETASIILGRKAFVGGAYLHWCEINALWAGPDAHAEFDARCEADAVAIAEACGHDMLRLRYWRWPKSEKPVRKIDDRTFLFGDPHGRGYTMTYHPEVELLARADGGPGPEQTGPGEPLGPELSRETLLREVREAEEQADSYSPPPGPDAALKSAIDKYPNYLIRHGGGTVHVDMRSPRELMAAADWPELVARKLMARARRLAGDIPAMAAAGLAVNVAGADFCSKHGPSISPRMFRQVVAPALKVLVDACHAHGMQYFYASDGDFRPVAEEMFDVVGVDGWFETDASAGMDLRELRRRFPRVCFQGTIRTQVLHRGTRDDVVREVMGCLAAAHDVGGILVGASNMIVPGTPPENVFALLETIEDNR